MSVRGWLNTNYNDFDSNNQGLRSRPLFIGFVLLSPRQKRFLAHLGTSAEGKVGPHPDLPKFIKEAIEAAQFSATLLIEPGLLHFELGWPNMLRWQGKLGPLQVEFRGGFIFRVSTHELVIGSSFLARGSLNIEAGFSAGVFGVKIRAYAEVAYGARYIGVLDFKNPGAGSALYAGIGLELYCEISIEFWIKFIFVKKTFRFSIGIGFTAALEVGLLGNDLPGIRGTGTISLKAMGRSMRFGITIAVHEDAVFEARRRTERFLQIGLEATDVESLPGLEPAALPETTATSSRALSFAARGEGPRAISAAAQDAFQAPDYSIFVIRAPNEEEEEVCYFVLYPQGERVNADGSVIPEAGFLPSPPNDDVAVTEDFVLQIPAGQASDNFELEHYDPAQNSWQSLTLSDSGPTEIRWQVDWDVVVIEGNEIDEASGELTEVQANLTLKQYLRYAFKWVSSEDEPPPGQVTPVGDPDLPQLEERLADERVHNPSDSAYEAAVRGAVKQFRGSPFFKRDPNYEYDQVLEQAFSADTSIYSADGTIPEDEADHDAMQNNEQADQLRGTIIQDLLSDVKDYAASPDEALAGQSIPFQMGLVFRVRGTRPAWLDQIIADGDSTPTIRQRLGPTSVEPATDGRQVRAFNIQLTAFDQNPPQFERVRYYSDADTIAITWDLSWDRLPAAGCTPCQADPEHHLFHYRVQRRPLNSQERELVYTVKTSEVLHRDLNEDQESVMKRLQPRFQIVDHFTQETLAEQAALPASGRSYLYSITPIDFAGNLGRPLTLVATRYPSEPPQVPVDGELIASYRVNQVDFAPLEIDQSIRPPLIVPERVQVTWTDPGARKDGPTVGIAQYRLIFRREATLPIGSYGLDSTTQGSRAKSLPSSNARPLPTDIEVTLVPEGPRGARRADIPLETLQSAGVFPSGEQPTWQPEAWRVYLQTESTNGVPSALAPVQLMLRMEAPPQGEVDLADLLEQREERRPAELEWLPKPTRLPLLPPEDQRAIPGVAHFPMPIKRLDFTITQNTLDKLEPDLNALGLSAQEAAQILTALTEMRDQAFEGQDYFLSAVADALDAFFTESLGNLILSHAERSAYVAPFDGALDNIAYQRHPAGIRCIRFRWNQGPSHLSNYLLDLNAGYHLLELDIDAHTDEIFSDRDKLARALRQIQEVQMLPAEDLSLAPGDTLAPNQWEAWYPSAILRRVEAAERAEGSQIPSGPWYSWRESILVWPTWLDLTDPPHQRKTMLHPLLSWIESALNGSGPIFSQAEDDAAALIDALISGDVALVRSELQARGLAVVPPIAITTIERDRFWQITGQQQIFSVRLEEEDGQSHLNTYWENYNLDLQVSPPFQPMTRETFLTSTAPKTDPYGWGILQRFGLSLTFSLRDAATGELVQGIDLLAAVKTVLDLKAQEPGLKHLHLELLVQPGQSVSLQEDSLAAESMLAMVQLSLRPRPVQMLRYTTMTIRGPAGQAVELVVKQDCSLINQADPAGGQVELDVTADAPGIHPVTLPFNGQTSILLRSANVFDANRLYVRFVPTESLPELLPPTFNLYFASRAAPSPHYAIIKSPSGLTEEERAEIEGILHEDDLGILDLELIFPQEFPVVDERSTYFTAPVDALAESFSHGSTPEGAEWRKFKRYAEALNSADSDADQIIVPLLQTDIEPILTDYLLWAQRFFDAGPDTVPAAEIADQPDGPWLATAYPRAGSPAYAAPDEAGRLQYDHLLEDKWAHTYRYYIRPYGRYDLLWRSFRQSLSLFPGQTTLPEPAVEATPDPDAGGLDVVLDRTHPVQKPLILRSERLDAPGTPGSPTVPGAIWEVIVAQHPEQALIERNQTLARQLAFRQVAFTLLRRFAYGRWLELLQSFKSDLDVTFIENTTAGIPGTYPAQPDHLDMDAPALTEEAVRSIALPERLSNFQQGALALQWDALPFYYEHRLLLIAQTAANVSPINEVVQRDFEYISPDPEATTQGVIGSNDIRARRVDIPLKRLWDSLPPLAQAQWPDEDPDAAAETNGALRPGALPDPEVVYQIIEFSRGNVEVQAELFFDFNGEAPDYSVRQLGQRFLAAILNPAADPIDPWPADDVLRVKLSQFTEEPLSQSCDIPDALQHKIKFRVHILVIEGVLTTTDLELLKTTITNPQDQASLDRIHQGWYSQEPISSLPPDSLQPPLQTLVDYPEVNECTLVWVGPVTDAEQEAILALPGDDPFQVALQRLAGAAQDAAQDAVIVEVAPLGPEQRPPDVPADLTFAVDETTGAISWTGLADEATLELLADGTTYTTLCWIGLLYDEEKNRVEPILRQWAQAPALLAALEALFEALEQRPFTRSLPGRPTQEDLPGLLRPKLLIGPDILSWTGPLPSDAERAALNSLTTEPQTDAHFKAAVTSLLNLIDADAQVPLAEEAVPPETLPEEIAGQLIVQETDGIQPLTWRGPAPNDVQQAILNEPGSFSTDQLFIEAVMALVELLNAPKETSLPSLVRPPDQPIPDSLQDNLTIEVDQVVWKGRPAAAAQLTDLASFADAIAAGDPDLKIALDAIANDLRTVPVDVALSIPIRPQPGQLPDSLIDRLLIGRAALRYHGLMTLDEGHTLQALFDLLPDRAAIQRLLASSMGKGMRDRELRIRARRGSATPSAMKPLADEKL
jgi:hypothetical protein